MASGVVSGLAHDARNLLSALELYCELLARPGVLSPRFAHYAGDLRRVGESGARLVEALAISQGPAPGDSPNSGCGSGRAITRDMDFSTESAKGCLLGTDPDLWPGLVTPRHPFPAIDDLGAEVLQLETMLRELAGPGLHLEIECEPCAGRLRLNTEELLRILFNLVANAVEALAGANAVKDGARKQVFTRPAGRLRITVQRGGGASFLPRDQWEAGETVVLSVRDNGPGIERENLARIFDPGFSTRSDRDPVSNRPLLNPSGLENAKLDSLRIKNQRRAGQGMGPQRQGIQSLTIQGLKNQERKNGGASHEEAGRSSFGRGLGLFIVRQLVEAAGGGVRAVSAPGLGTRFDIELPLPGPRHDKGIRGSLALEETPWADGIRQTQNFFAARNEKGE